MISASKLQDVLMQGGEPADVTKIEIEILDDGRCRWNLFDHGRRLYSAVARPDDQAQMLEATRIIVDTMTMVRDEKD